MAIATTGAADAWAWIYEPLQALKQAAPDTTWPARREQFLSSLGLAEPDQHPAVAELIHSLDEMTDDDRERLLGSDQLDTLAWESVDRHSVSDEGASEPAAASDDGYDDAAWGAFLAESLPAWDGSELSWAAFREWFLDSAGRAGVAGPASALIAHLDGQDATQRIDTFAQYGHVVTPPADAPGGVDPGSGSEEAAAGTVALSEEAESAIDELISEHPEFEELSEERMRELAAEVLAGLEEDGAGETEDESEDTGR